MGSQFDALQIFAMKETNISEKDHKEWAELDFIMIHSSRKCEQKTTRFSNVIFHRICPFWDWEVNEVRNNQHRIRNLKNKQLSFKVLQFIRIYSIKISFEKASCGYIKLYVLRNIIHDYVDLQFAKNAFLAHVLVKALRGHSTTTWTEYCNFLPPPPCMDTFLFPECGQKQTFF